MIALTRTKYSDNTTPESASPHNHLVLHVFLMALEFFLDRSMESLSV